MGVRGVGGVRGVFSDSGPSGEQKTTLHDYLGQVQEIPQDEQNCTSLQESGTIRLSSANTLILLDSLLREMLVNDIEIKVK